MVKRRYIGHLTFDVTVENGVVMRLYDGRWYRSRRDIYKLARARARRLDPERPNRERRSRMHAQYERRR